MGSGISLGVVLGGFGECGKKWVDGWERGYHVGVVERGRKRLDGGMASGTEDGRIVQAIRGVGVFYHPWIFSHRYIYHSHLFNSTF